MKNLLADHLSPWKAWYALVALPALLIGSFVMVLAGPDETGGGSGLKA